MAPSDRDPPLVSLPDWLTQAQDVPLASFMTHYAPDPVAEDIGRRTRQVGQNLWNTWTAPIAAAKHLGEAATSGTLDVTNPETAGSGLELAAAIAGGRMPFAKPGEVGIFGGKLAKTADLAALDRAQKMEAGGAYPDDIWTETGWFQGPDKKWRFEIPDERSAFRRHPDPDTNLPLSEVMHHPAAYAAYPDLASISVNRSTFGADRGTYWPPQPAYGNQGEHISLRAGMVDPRSTALHEIQHAIQNREGFDPGGQPAPASPIGGQYLTKTEQYRRSAGETEARNVQGRRDWPPERRREVPPDYSQDVPTSQQILRSGEYVGPQSSNEVPLSSLPERIAALEQSLGRKLRPDLSLEQVEKLEQAGSAGNKSSRYKSLATVQARKAIGEDVYPGAPKSEPREPLERTVIDRGRSGRPIVTEPLSIGTENSILEEGLSGWKERKRDYAYAQSPESHAIEAFQNDRSRAEIAARGRPIPEYLKNGATAADLSPEGRKIYNQLIDFSKRSDLPKIPLASLPAQQ